MNDLIAYYRGYRVKFTANETAGNEAPISYKILLYKREFSN